MHQPDKVTMMNVFSQHAAWMMCVVMVMALRAGTVLASPAPEKVDQSVVARVNGTAIYLEELESRVDIAKARYRKSGYRSITPDFEKRIQRQELDQLIDIELLAQAGAQVSDKEFAKEVELRISAMSKARFHNASSAQQAAPPEVDVRHREQLRRDALVEVYLDKRGINTLQVPEKDVEEFYEKNKKGFTEPEKVKVSHILIELPRNAKAEEVEVARSKAQRISEELKSGRDFAGLAKQYSTCATAAQGGDLGYIQIGFMPKDFNAVAFSLKPGEVSEPVRTQHGFHVVKVIEKQPARVPELSEVKATITKYLINDYKRKKIDEIIAELKQKARIEMYLNG